MSQMVRSGWARMGGALALVAGLAVGLVIVDASAQNGARPDDRPGVNAAEVPGSAPGATSAKPGGDEDEGEKLKPFAEVSKGFEKVVSTADGKSFYTLWTRKRDGAMLAELPSAYASQKHFFAMTVPTGETFAGLQAGDMYLYWKKIDNRLVLIEPNLGTRSTGDQESKDAIRDVFTDRVVLDVPILSTGPGGGPVIDMKALLMGKAREFYGGQAAGINQALAVVKKAKAFPENVEVAYEAPTAGGKLQQFHYSISLIKDDPSYKARVADERVGYFTTVYRDLGKYKEEDKWVRHVNRWHLEKRDPSLKKSPPKQPIVFYMEHTVPVRYRRFVRDGVLMWNKAFEKVGFLDAIEVRQQDASTGAYMDIDPEDVRYNFIRWVTNDIGTAIGPSRVNPMTGQILDADVVLTDGWIRHFWSQFNEVMPELAMESFTPETLAWLATRPNWDPRVRLADPAKRDYLIAQRARRGVLAYGGHPIGLADPEVARAAKNGPLVGEFEYDGLVGRTSQVSGLCMASRGKAIDMAMMRMNLDMLSAEELDDLAPNSPGAPGTEADKAAGKDKKKDLPYDTIDGVPEWFVGPALADLTAHEVGHTLGLRHNFKASSIYTFNEVNGPELKGKKTWAGSVMDYNPTNFVVKDGKPQGDFVPIDIGPYDHWAIEYGYTTEDPANSLKRVAEPELVYATDEDTVGPDPLARRYDFAKDPLDYAKSQMDLARYHRGRLIEKFAKEGKSWSRVRKGYEITLGMQLRSLSMMANWVGGAHVNRDRKGDPNARSPIAVVPTQQQRDALRWCIDNAFFDEAFGLTPELLEKMTVDKWLDEGGWREATQEPTWPVHDRIAGIQSSVLTMLMNPTTLRRVYDNEYRVASDQDMLTLPELLDAVGGSVWTELDKSEGGKHTARKPLVSSLRRNLQQEHLDRLVDLVFESPSGEAGKPVQTLAVMHLRRINEKIRGIIDDKGRAGGLDPYTQAHLADARTKIEKALDANYVRNAGGMGGGFPYWMFFGQPADAREHGQGVVDR